MTQPDIRLSSESVRKHALAVDELGHMIDEGLAGAVHVQASAASYGVLVGGLFTSILNPFQDNAVGELKNAVSTSQRLADTLRAVAADFDASDADAARRLGG
ncbi:type VII secretion target [Krasilnikovia sp. MM14-A1004]|uniref:type VII secretion target n=1 Tax=Krasilnikovia sp. MM14-A1004 TaxID=3373541 RepID=UPI00399CF58D